MPKLKNTQTGAKVTVGESHPFLDQPRDWERLDKAPAKKAAAKKAPAKKSDDED